MGPAARCTRILADYGATVVKVGAVPGRGAEPIRPPFYAYSGARYLQRTAIDLKVPEGRAAFLALVATADVVVESFRPGVVDRLGIGFPDLQAVNPRVILCSTTGYGQHGPHAAWAGHDINYLAVGGYLATTEPRADGGPRCPAPPLPMPPAAACRRPWPSWPPSSAGARTAPAPPRRLHRRRCAWMTSLAVDEYLATGAPVGPGHNIITGRYACYDTYQAADGGWLAVGAIEPSSSPTCAGSSVPAVDGPPAGRRRPGGHPGRLPGRLRHPGPRRLGGRLAGADTCVTPV